MLVSKLKTPKSPTRTGGYKFLFYKRQLLYHEAIFISIYTTSHNNHADGLVLTEVEAKFTLSPHTVGGSNSTEAGVI
jgi:hypothetical protein